MQFWEDVDKGLDDIEAFFAKKGQDIDRIRQFTKRCVSVKRKICFVDRFQHVCIYRVLQSKKDLHSLFSSAAVLPDKFQLQSALVQAMSLPKNM
jgi:hypothetical protein